MTQTPNSDDDRNDWHDFLSPRYTGPKFDETPNRRARRKQRRAWQKQRRAEQSSQIVDSLQEQRREDPTPPATMLAALVILFLIVGGAFWLVPKLFGGEDSNSGAAAPAVTATDTPTETTTPTPTKTPAAAPTLDAAKPDDLAKQWVTSYLTRESSSDDAWQETVREHTTDGLMSEIEDTNWPDGSVFTDCDALKVKGVELVDAPPNTPVDTDTRWTRVANVSTSCDGETVRAPIRIQVVQDDGQWRVGQAVEMVAENRD